MQCRAVSYTAQANIMHMLSVDAGKSTASIDVSPWQWWIALAAVGLGGNWRRRIWTWLFYWLEIVLLLPILVPNFYLQLPCINVHFLYAGFCLCQDVEIKWDPNNTWSGGIFNSVVYVFYDTLCTIGESVSHINISCQSYFAAVATDTSEYKPIVFVG